jgi:hypothetical protein
MLRRFKGDKIQKRRKTGDLATHPRYHLHVGCWRPGDTKLPIIPRFRVPEVTLEDDKVDIH